MTLLWKISNSIKGTNKPLSRKYPPKASTTDNGASNRAALIGWLT